MTSKRIVLFLPHRANPDHGVRVAADLLPLELLQIAGIPDREGYEVVIVDAMVHPDYMDRLMELCDGALLFGSSCILGFQVAHGAQVAKAIRERFPDLPIIWGGWFPSVIPEMYLEEGIADAVALGQGEMTFWELIQAIENGTDLAEVPGLAIMRDGRVHYTDHRQVIGFDVIPDVPWHLIDYEEYATLQANSGPWKLRHKYPDPWGMKPGTVVRGFSYFSSFGCPEPCSFCCSPEVTGQRWKALPGKLLAERLLECQERFNFNVMRFQDANFGVAEKRSNAFCDALIEADTPFWWSGTYEVTTLVRYKSESLDRMRDSHCHMVSPGAETGSQEMQERIKKNIDVDHFELAMRKMFERGITTGTSWIIGFPGESHEAMHATLRMAANIKHKFPGSASDIFPFRPIPGSADFHAAVKLGYVPPASLEEWGTIEEYKYDVERLILPKEIMRVWKRYGATATFYDGLANEGSGPVRRMMKGISAWRLKTGCYTFPLEHKLFHSYVRLTGRTREDVIKSQASNGSGIKRTYTGAMSVVPRGSNQSDSLT
jgi:radical SAM superfamily enzyme YgiQ (UPF0313 family)